MGRCRLNGSDGQHRRRSFQASIPKALRRFIRFTRVKTLKPGSAAALWAPDVGPPRETLTPTPTWTGPPSHSHGAQLLQSFSNRTHAPSSLQNIRLSSAAANRFRFLEKPALNKQAIVKRCCTDSLQQRSDPRDL